MIHALDTQRVPIGSVKPYKGNARRGDLALIKESLEANGQYRALIVRRGTREILVGNNTWLAAKELGWTEIAVSYIRCNAAQAKRINLVDNRANDKADYDYEALLAQLQSLPDFAGTGFDEDALREVLAELDDDPASGKTDVDDIPAPPATPKTKAGDIWVLGEHRLICGDSTKPLTMGRLVDGVVDVVWTDPPYNVAYEGGTGMTMENDDLEEGAFEKMLEDSLGAAADVTPPGAPIYICHAEQMRLSFQRAMVAAGWFHRQTLVWVKNSLVLGRQDYQWQHEPILYGWKPGAAHSWYGGFDKTTVIDDEIDPSKLNKRELVALVRAMRTDRDTTVVRVDKPSRNELHPTSKPVALIQHCLRNSSQRGDRVLDPFGGSGSTMIAAETLGRTAYLAELDPKYCDVIVRRWEDFTGRAASRGKAVKALARG